MTRKYFKGIFIFFIVFSYICMQQAFAADRAVPFEVGETLDPGAESPACGPTDANCFPNVTAGGSLGQLQFNNGSNGFGASSALSFSTSTASLLVGTSTVLANLSVQGTSTSPTANLFALASSSGTTLLSVGPSGGITLSASTPISTSNTLYNLGSSLYWNGSVLSALTSTQGYTITFDGSGNQVATSTLFISSDTNVGIGTTTPYAKFTVDGGASDLGSSATAGYFIADTNTSSVLPYASTTAITVSGTSYLGTVASGLWNGTAIGDAYITKTGAWTGTFDGQEGVYYLDRANHTGTQTSSTISDFDSTARALLSSSALGLTYNSGTGAFTLTSGYNIPLTASTTEWASAYASTTALTPSYIRGQISTDATGLTYTGGILSLTSGYNIPLTASSTNWNTFYDTPSTRITAGSGLSWAGNTLSATGGGSGNSAFTIGSGVIYNATSSDNVGIGTSTPSSKLTVAGDVYAGGNITATGTLALSGTATSTFAGGISIAGSIVPTVDNTYSLGSASLMWKDVYIGPGSLYINGQKVLEDVSNNIVVSADLNQSLVLKTTGTGDIELNPSGGGLVYVKGNTIFSAGKTVSTSDNSALSFDDGIAPSSIVIAGDTITDLSGSNLEVSGNVLRVSNTPSFTYINATSTTATSTFSGGALVATGGGNLGVGTSTTLAKLDVYGNAIFSGSSRYINFGNVSGTSGYGFRDNGGTLEYKDSGGSWTTFASLASAGTSTLPQGYLSGLTLSNNSGDASHDIDIAAGVARDLTDNASISLSSSITKQIDASWAVGTNAGGLDAGTVTASTTYHVWLINRSDTGVVDALFSTSASNPTMPANYDYKRRIGAVITDGSANIRGFVQDGDTFSLTVPVLVYDSTVGTTATLLSVIAPSGIRTTSVVNANITSSTANTGIYLSDPSVNTADPTVAVTTAPGMTIRIAAANTSASQKVNVITNTSAQIMADASAAATALRLVSLGWIDNRADFSTGGGGANGPTGSNGQIQFNSSGAFGASSNFYWDNTNGRLGIGTSTPTANLHASGTIRFSTLGSGTLTTDSSGNLTVSSDERLKDIRGSFARGLVDILKINPIVYKWKEFTGYDTINEYSGFSAQNIRDAIPEAVATSSSGYLSLQDRPIIATLVNAVKEIWVKLEKIIAWFSETGDKFKIQGDVCVDDVCVTKEEFKAILQGSVSLSSTSSIQVESTVSDGSVTSDVESPVATTTDQVRIETESATSTEEVSASSTPAVKEVVQVADPIPPTSESTSVTTETSSATPPPNENPASVEEAPVVEASTEDVSTAPVEPDAE